VVDHSGVSSTLAEAETQCYRYPLGQPRGRNGAGWLWLMVRD
jgi:hypothetical protein